jgi:F0F1-type ATP synthase delta subunit
MNLLETILGNTYTKTDLQHRVTLLREFLEYQFFKPHDKVNLVYLLNEFINTKGELRDEFNALMAWDFSFYSQFNKENVYNVLEQIEKESEKLPVVTIYLPFVLPIFETPKLGNWLRKNIASNVIAEIKTDATLIGGCSVVWNGEYRDFSLRSRMGKHKGTVKKY